MQDDQICSEGFDGVAAKAHKLLGAAGGGSLCVYLRGAPVVDIWAGDRDPATGADQHTGRARRTHTTL